MSGVVQPTPAPNVELELAKLANDAMQNGADPHDVTTKLHQTISYLRQFPQMADHATNALADGVASPADITRMLWPHVQAQSHATGSNAPTDEEMASVEATPSAGLATLGSAGGIMDAPQAFVRSKVRGQSYREALGDIQHAEGNLPASERVGERFAGSLPALAAVPGGAVASGAAIGGLDAATDPNPDESLGMRAAKTAGGAATGALGGKVMDMVVGGVTSALAPNAAKFLLQRQADRAGSAKRLYDAALAQGKASLGSSAVQKFLAEPDIAPIVQDIVGSRQGAGIDPNGAEMLDRVYKELTDQAGDLDKSLQSPAARAANSRRYQAGETKMAQQQALRATEAPDVSGQPMMGGYRGAVEDFAQRSSEMDAFKRGYDAMATETSANLPNSKALTRTTGPAFQEWLSKASPAEQDAARLGAAARARMAMQKSPLSLGRKSIGALPSLGNDPVVALGQRAGLGGLNAHLMDALTNYLGTPFPNDSKP